MTRVEAVVPEVARLLTGRLEEGPDYATWRSRGTSDWLLVHTVAGAGRFGAPTGEMLARPGDSHLLAPGTPHDYSTAPGSDRWEILFAHFHPRPDWLPLLSWPEPVPGIRHLRTEGRAEQEVRRHLGAAVRALRSVGDQRELFAVNALEAALLWCHTEDPSLPRIDERIGRALSLIEDDLAGPLHLAGLAAASLLSVSRFSHLFREQVGDSPARFVERQRMNRARQLLELSARSVASIAREVGYESPLYFSTRFRAHVGVSPTRFRREAAERSRVP